MRTPALLGPTLALAVGIACDSADIPTPVDACELDYETRARIDGDAIEVEIWVTAWGADRLLEIPDCMAIAVSGDIYLPCDGAGEIDLTQCQPGSFVVREETSLLIARIRRPIAGDTCSEPLEAGVHNIDALGLETGQLRVCRVFSQIAIPDTVD